MIVVCRQVLGYNYMVHVPRQGALGLTSFVQLKTFIELLHMVYGFLLGQIIDFWLLLEEESGRYFVGHKIWITAKSQRWYVTKTVIANLTMGLIEKKWSG
jgi:hypothetical protein